MNEISIEALTEAVEGDFDLASFLGRQQAFGAVAGRCSAAQAACIREIYEKKLYKNRCSDWGQFCREYLHISRTHVQHIINLLNEFGPQYFLLSSLTRVSPETYRAIRPAIQDGNLHVEGEAIALIPANTARISAAVAGMRKTARPRPVEPAPPVAPSTKERVAALGQRCSDILAEFAELTAHKRHQHELAAMLVNLQTGLDRLQLQM